VPVTFLFRSGLVVLSAINGPALLSLLTPIPMSLKRYSRS